MPVNFPSSPALNDTYTYAGRVWKWNGKAWESVSSAYGPSGVVSVTAPITNTGTSTAAVIGVTLGTTAGTVSEGNHTHDNRYYTETESDTLLAAKAPIDASGYVTATNYKVGLVTESSDTVALNFSTDGGLSTRTATGTVTFTGSSYTAGATITARVVAGASIRSLVFPSGWVFMGSKPTQIAANKSGILTVTSFGTTEADCIASWVAQL
jgi:hypothetical protein